MSKGLAVSMMSVICQSGICLLGTQQCIQFAMARDAYEGLLKELLWGYVGKV